MRGLQDSDPDLERIHHPENMDPDPPHLSLAANIAQAKPRALPSGFCLGELLADIDDSRDNQAAIAADLTLGLVEIFLIRNLAQ
jgi:hypothetical protein